MVGLVRAFHLRRLFQPQIRLEGKRRSIAPSSTVSRQGRGMERERRKEEGAKEME